MKQYIYKGPICNTIYRRYNKEYCTPPIYAAYNFNWILCLFGVLTSVIYTAFPDEYAYIFWIEAALGLGYLINAVIIKNAFTSGLLNKSISDRSKMFVFVKIIAYTSQICLFQTIVPVTMALFGNLDVVNGLSPITITISGVLFVFNIILPFGLNCEKHYNKNAQIAYSYVIEGPSRNNESIEDIYKSLDVEAMHTLKHYDAATSKYYQARDAVSKASVNLRKIIDGYDEAWRNAIIYSQYMYQETIPCRTPQSIRLADAILTTNGEVKKLNAVIDTINAREYIPLTKKTAIHKAPNNKKHHETPPVCTKPVEQKEDVVVDVVWDYQVNWY